MKNFKIKNLNEVIDFKKVARNINRGYDFYDEDEFFYNYVGTISSGANGLINQVRDFYEMFFGEEIEVEEGLIDDFDIDRARVGSALTEKFHKLYPEHENWWFEIVFNDTDSDLDVYIVTDRYVWED